MLLVEADGKALLRASGIAIPESVLAAETAPALAGTGPWVVKAQVPVGGRGKAGGVVLCKTKAEIDTALKRLIGAQIKGHQVRSCLIEAAVTGADEYYLSLIVDPANYGVRVMLTREGGVDVEQTSVAAAHSRGLDVQMELGKKHDGGFTDGTLTAWIEQGKEWLDAGAVEIGRAHV